MCFFFQISLMYDLGEKSGWLYLPLHLNYFNVVLIEVEENLVSHSYIDGEGIYFHRFLKIIVDIVLWYYTKTHQVIFLVVFLQHGIWNYINYLFMFWYIKIHWFTLHFEYL